MTPLAHRIAKELTLPKARRTFRDGAGILDRLDDVHCFELSEVFETCGNLAERLANDVGRAGRMVGENLFFLPAPRTWLEWRGEDGSRQGVLLIEHVEDGADGEMRWAECLWAAESAAPGFFMSSPKIGQLLLRGAWPKAGLDFEFPVPRHLNGETEAQMRGWIFWLLSALAMINTPRVIGRKQHMPHAGLQRAIAKSKGIVGKFPLNAWTEIQLRITPPDYQGDGGTHDAYLTGAKALHFVRSHLRIRLGRLELVRAHWRGDPALGIKQSRYRLAA